MNDLPKDRPPSERSSRTFGILALCSHLLCLLGAPFAALFGILALVRHGRARREHEAARDRLAVPGNAGQVMGIVALAGLVMTLPMTGIVSAIAIPALLGQRARARAKAVHEMVAIAAAETARTANALRDASGRIPDGGRVIQEVLRKPEFSLPQARNPYGGSKCPYRVGPTAGPGTVSLTFHAAYLDAASGRTYPAILVEGCFADPARPQAPVLKVVAVALD